MSIFFMKSRNPSGIQKSIHCIASRAGGLGRAGYAWIQMYGCQNEGFIIDFWIHDEFLDFMKNIGGSGKGKKPAIAKEGKKRASMDFMAKYKTKPEGRPSAGAAIKAAVAAQKLAAAGNSRARRNSTAFMDKYASAARSGAAGSSSSAAAAEAVEDPSVLLYKMKLRSSRSIEPPPDVADPLAGAVNHLADDEEEDDEEEDEEDEEDEEEGDEEEEEFTRYESTFAPGAKVAPTLLKRRSSSKSGSSDELKGKAKERETNCACAHLPFFVLPVCASAR